MKHFPNNKCSVNDQALLVCKAHSLLFFWADKNVTECLNISKEKQHSSRDKEAPEITARCQIH
jgi:hypothetical protein